jgi:hypothetical protein
MKLKVLLEFSLLAGGGLGYDNAGKNRVSEIGDSHCRGILQGEQALIITLEKDGH